MRYPRRRHHRFLSRRAARPHYGGCAPPQCSHAAEQREQIGLPQAARILDQDQPRQQVARRVTQERREHQILGAFHVDFQRVKRGEIRFGEDRGQRLAWDGNRVRTGTAARCILLVDMRAAAVAAVKA
jgi:hypothetical protein